MRRLYTIILFITLGACADEDMATSNSSLAVRMACLKCHTSPSQMKWLDELIINTASQGETKGNIYLLTDREDGPIIIHQPFIMSCAGCVQYDCAGNLLTPYDLGVWPSMDKSTLIYAPN